MFCTSPPKETVRFHITADVVDCLTNVSITEQSFCGSKDTQMCRACVQLKLQIENELSSRRAAALRVVECVPLCSLSSCIMHAIS